jgi:glutamate-1-semialdehyde 2,1-aminomutase
MPSLSEIGPRISAGEYPLLPISAGIPDSTKRRIHTVNFNDLESVEHVFKTHSIACLITEPALQNVGVVHPLPGYLEGLRRLCDQYGVVFILDEVKTGFRSALGGYQGLAGIRPDLSIFGKAVANGYPLGVLGGRKDMMDLFADPDPKKRVLVAGTYNGHPINAAAAIATLQVLRRNGEAIYADIEARSVHLQKGLEDLFHQAGITVTIARNASASCVYFMDHAPTDWHDILEHHDFERDRKYRAALINEGIYHFPVPAKQGSISAAHSKEDIEETLAANARVIEHLR